LLAEAGRAGNGKHQECDEKIEASQQRAVHGIGSPWGFRGEWLPYPTLVRFHPKCEKGGLRFRPLIANSLKRGTRWPERGKPSSRKSVPGSTLSPTSPSTMSSVKDCCVGIRWSGSFMTTESI